MTIADLKTNVANTFPRQASPGWNTYFDTNLPQWLYELCDFPFWFLIQSPSPAYWANFPITDYTTVVLQYGDWALNGWLVLQTGIGTYSIAAPFEEDHEADNISAPGWWDIFQASQIMSAKLHDDDGTMLCDLEVLPPNAFHARIMIGESNGGTPRFMTLKTTESGSYINLWPRPYKQFSLAISWAMRESPVYLRPGDYVDQYSKFLNFASQAVYYKCLYHSADFFDEDGMMKKFSEQLWGMNGLPKVDTNAITTVGGIIGRLKDETYAKNDQSQKQIPWFGSCKRATGRGNGNRYGWGPYGGYYMGNSYTT